MLRAGFHEDFAALHRSTLSVRLHARELRGRQNREYLLFSRRE